MRRATASQRATAVYVATDDERIAQHVRNFNGNVVMPSGDFATGSDRIAAALELLDGSFDQVINVQGDEPLIDVASIDRIIDELQATGADMATLACPLSPEEFNSRDVVKVVTTLNGDALYFSRAPIPHGHPEAAKRHVGLYGYQAAVLRSLAALPATPLEQAESLEQLRALQNGFKIRVLETARPHLGVDRPEDVQRVEAELANHV